MPDLTSVSVSLFLLLSVAALFAPCSARGNPTSANCTSLTFSQDIDHFNWGPLPLGLTHYNQRYFICDQYWDRTDPHAPVFFYFGNEDTVTLYVNNTGLMWEHAAQFKALLVFAEHRYYGESIIFPAGTPRCMDWMTTEQAMADFATLITFLKSNLTGPDAAWVGFGGSYGGMLASWFRIKYPYLIDGVIAASAPIWSFLGFTPPYDSSAFYQVVTDDASAAGGATDTCKKNFRAALPRMWDMASTPAGLSLLSSAFHTCSPLRSQGDAAGLVSWVQDPWATLAMGDFPYESSYLLHGHGLLPPWPVRVACRPLAPATFPDDASLFAAVREAVGVYYNYSGTVPCFYNGAASNQPYASSDTFSSSSSSSSDSISSASSRLFPPLPRARMAAPRRRQVTFPAPQTSPSSSPFLYSPSLPTPANDQCVGDWGYQWCTEIVQPFSSGTGNDMFWPASPFNLSESIANCVAQWGVRPRATWAHVGFANNDLRDTSNIVFSNGQLDPWHTGGVLHNISSTVVSLMIPNGAHHLDLMFSNPADPPDVIAVRAEEIRHVAQWIQQRAQTRGAKRV